MTPTEATVAFARVARPILLEYLPSRSCIASCRAAIECLRHFGVEARALPVMFMVHVNDLKKVYIAGGRPPNATFKDVVSEINLPADPGGSWCGHLIVETRTFLLDPSFDQALSAVADGARVVDGPQILVLPHENAFSSDRFEGVFFQIKQDHDNAALIDGQYIGTDDHSYTETPAWEPDHLTIPVHRIVQAMKAAKWER